MTMTAKFAGKCTVCGSGFAAGTKIEWERGAGSRHADVDECNAAKAARVAAATSDAGAVTMAPIAAFLNAAKERGLKFPKARFLAPGGGELRLSVAGEQSAAPGSVQVKIDDVWIGRVHVDGSIYGHGLRERADVQAALNTIALDPAGAAKEYGRLMGRCAFCDARLTDDRSGASVEHGYGQRCASRWGLPWAAKGKVKAMKALPLDGRGPVDNPIDNVVDDLDRIGAVAGWNTDTHAEAVSGQADDYGREPMADDLDY